MDATKTILGLATRELQLAAESDHEYWRERHSAMAYAYYTSAWVTAGLPAACAEWPGFATWSARETMRRAA